MGQRLAEITAFGSSCTANAAHVREAALPVLENLLVGFAEETAVHTLAARLADHAKFLNNVVEKAGTGTKVADHTECAFGCWYNGEGGKTLGHLPAWMAVDGPHRGCTKPARPWSGKPGTMSPRRWPGHPWSFYRSS